MLDRIILFVSTIGLFFTLFGISVLYQTSYSVPPIPAGWLIGVIMCIIGTSVDMTGLLAIFVIKKKIMTWIYGVTFGTTILVLGIRSIIINNFELPLCPCNPGFYGAECLPCPNCSIYSELCDDGAEGTGDCICKKGWAGKTCSICADTFAGPTCSECKRGWDGPDCNICSHLYIGPNCNQCKVNVLVEEDEQGILCERCEPGSYGPLCISCPVCTTHDSLAVCKDNDYHETNVYNSELCTETPTLCSDNFDCDSHNCRGKCVFGFLTDNTICETTDDCAEGFTCDFKTCCAEERYGDGTCDCGRSGFAGPFCEPCPGFDGIYSSSICGGHGTCTATYNDNSLFSGLTCDCAANGFEGNGEWTGEICSCLKTNVNSSNCTACADGTFGPNCTPCPGGAGISQCSYNGKCEDGVTGDGSCNCNVDISYKGLGGWGGDSCSNCYSNDFYGNKCETCPNIMVVGCHTTTNVLAFLPGTDKKSCIQSCGFKTCNTNTGFCEHET